jgi:D-aspartate ligase
MNFTPVIFGGYVNGYSLARAFYETYKIKSVICDIERKFSYHSIFCNLIIVENPNKNVEKFIYSVKNIGKAIRSESKLPLLLVTNDIWLIPLAKYKNELEDIYIYSFSGWDIIEKFVNKNTLYSVSDLLGIPYPKTVIIDSNKNINIKQLNCPLLVKPSDVNQYTHFFPDKKRNRIFDTEEKTLEYIESIYINNYTGCFIIQEYIPGGVENLYTCTTYSNNNGEIKAASTGCKLSQSPAEAGTITSGLVKYCKEIIESTKIILESNHFFGIANTEFKYDKRDNTYKLIEVNARPGMWNYSVFLSGVNLIEYLVDDIIHNRTLFYNESKENLIWTVIPKWELNKNFERQENTLLVSRLLNEGRVFNPIINRSDGVIYKFRYNFLTFKASLKYLFKKIF